jgi:PAP2 superfamily protein
MAAGVAAVYAVALFTAVGRRLDVAVFERVSGSGLAQVDRVSSRALDTVDVATVLLAGSLLFLLVFSRGRRRSAVVAFTTAIAAIATTELLKPALGPLSRSEAPTRPYEGSYPSGHATVAMAIGLAALLAAPRVLRPTVAAAAAAYATIIGVALVALGSHLPSDVVGGYLVAGAWAAVASTTPGETREPPAAARPPRDVGTVLAVTLALACAGAVAAVVATHPQFAHALALRRTLFVTALVYAAETAVVTGVVVALTAARPFPRRLAGR